MRQTRGTAVNDERRQTAGQFIGSFTQWSCIYHEAATGKHR